MPSPRTTSTLSVLPHALAAGGADDDPEVVTAATWATDDGPTDDGHLVPDTTASTTSEGMRYLNRELSWLQFNERVLALADDDSVPLLERVRFLAIFQTNLDEFVKVRVAGLKQQRAAALTGTGADGATPSQQLAAIATVMAELTARQYRIFHDDLSGRLADHGVRFVKISDLSADDLRLLSTTFDEQILPVLTPLAVDPAHPFPYISSESLNLAVLVRDPSEDDGDVRFARIKVPSTVDRFVILDADNSTAVRLVAVEDVIAHHLDHLFPGLQIVEHHTFRLLRNADFAVEEEADDLLAAIETELLRRRFGEVVRLEVEPSITAEVLELLTDELGINDDDVAVLPGPLDLGGLATLTELDRPDLKHPPLHAIDHPLLHAPSPASSNLFEILRDHDVLVHHPYEAFSTSVLALLEQAARDPDVLAIKQTLYRTSGPGSPVIRALADAARAGKQVVALIELKARFDEAVNISWARSLEEAGVHVAYGVVGLKTHAKIALIVRQEHGKIRRYAHIGTGNYNERTARLYEDLGLLTSDEQIGADLTDLFNVLTGYSRHRAYRRLVVAPDGLRPRMLELIRREAAADDGHIVAKFNSLIDPEMIDALYDASQHGTRIELIVRGICGLRPGVNGLSDNITVRSIVGRVLEHARIYRFGSRARGRDYLIGSADLMERNLDRRVETLVPIDHPALQSQIDSILTTMLADDTQAWELGADTRWHRVISTHGVRAHDVFQRIAPPPATV